MDPQLIPEETSRLLSWLDRGWIPAPEPPGKIETLKFGDDDISKDVRTLIIGPDNLEIRCEGLYGAINDRSETLLQNPIEGVTTNSWELSAQIAYISERSFSETRDCYTLKAQWASLRLPDQSVRFWYARVIQPIKFSSNLTIVTNSPDQQQFSSLNLRLNSVYIYYVLNSKGTKRNQYMLIDPILPDISADEALKELQLLQLSLGLRFKLTSLTGLTADGKVACYEIGTTIGHSQADLQIFPVPIDDINVWVAPFFKQLSQYAQGRQQRLVSALDYYLESRLGYLDVQYLHVQIAINSLAQHILEQDPQDYSLQVTDPDAWTHWIDQIADSIRQHAKGGSEDHLVASVISTAKAPLDQLIRAAAQRVGVNLTPEFEYELSHWAENQALGWKSHQDLSESGNMRDGLQRIAILRTMFVALLSKLIGYTGPICGLSNDPLTLKPTIYWLSETEEACPDQMEEAKRKYLADVKIDYPPVGVLWPEFIPPEIPKTGLLGMIDEFGWALASHTHHTVTARLQPVVKGSGDPGPMYDFALVPIDKPELQSLLFTVVEENGSLRIKDWKDEDLIVHDPVHLNAFLSDVAHSLDTATRIERLVTFAQSLKSARSVI